MFEHLNVRTFMGRINVRTSSDVRSRMRYHAQTNGPLGRNNILGWNGKGKRPPPPDPAGGRETPPRRARRVRTMWDASPHGAGAGPVGVLNRKWGKSDVGGGYKTINVPGVPNVFVGHTGGKAVLQ